MSNYVIKVNNVTEASAVILSTPINRNTVSRNTNDLLTRAQTWNYPYGIRITNGALAGYERYSAYRPLNNEFMSFRKFMNGNIVTETNFVSVTTGNNIAIKANTLEEAKEILANVPYLLDEENYGDSYEEWLTDFNECPNGCIYSLNEEGKIAWYGDCAHESVSKIYNTYAEYAAGKVVDTTYVAIKTTATYNKFADVKGFTKDGFEKYKSKTILVLSNNGEIIEASNTENVPADTAVLNAADGLEYIKSHTKYNVEYVRTENIQDVRYIYNKCGTFVNIPLSECYSAYNDCLYAIKLINGKVAGTVISSDSMPRGASIVTMTTKFGSNVREEVVYKACEETGVTTERLVLVDNKLLAKSYVTANYKYCIFCNKYHKITDGIIIDNSFVCNSCAETRVQVCPECGEKHLDTNMVRFDYNGNDMTLCRDCYNEQYTTCNHCGATVRREDARVSVDGSTYCGNCYRPSRHGDSVKNYTFKPTPIFYGDKKDGRYFGIELEVDNGDECASDAAFNALTIANADNQFRMYCKHDGSLDEGFENVSHPMTLKYHMETMPWKDIFSSIIEDGFRSHNTGTCGLHVHVNRESLGTSREEQDETIGKIIYLVEKFWDNIVRFTRRKADCLTRWAAPYGMEAGDTPDKLVEKAKKTERRYHAINLCNYHTIEFRMFRGTLNYNTFIATLQFVNLLCETAKTKNDTELIELTWADIVGSVTETELTEYLKKRGIYLVNGDASDADEV